MKRRLILAILFVLLPIRAAAQHESTDAGLIEPDTAMEEIPAPRAAGSDEAPSSDSAIDERNGKAVPEKPDIGAGKSEPAGIPETVPAQPPDYHDDGIIEADPDPFPAPESDPLEFAFRTSFSLGMREYTDSDYFVSGGGQVSDRRTTTAVFRYGMTVNRLFALELWYGMFPGVAKHSPGDEIVREHEVAWFYYHGFSFGVTRRRGDFTLDVMAGAGVLIPTSEYYRDETTTDPRSPELGHKNAAGFTPNNYGESAGVRGYGLAGLDLGYYLGKRWQLLLSGALLTSETMRTAGGRLEPGGPQYTLGLRYQR